MRKVLNTPNNHVTRTIQVANTTVPYYMDKYKQLPNEIDFQELPYTTKDDIIAKKLPMLNMSYQNKFSTGELMMGRSSGTTGKITEIYYDPKEHTKSLQELWFYRLKWYGIHAGKDKVLYFYPTADQTPGYYDDDSRLALSKSYLFSEENIIKALELIRNANVKYAIIQPSTAIVLYNIWFKHNLAPVESIQYIEFNGEFLESTVIDKIQRICPNAKVANQYGLQELQSVAFSCACGNMHLMTSNCYTEIVNKDENGIGDICLTTLKNSVMPYVRFITGDKGYIDYQTKCECGCKNPILHLTRGRDNDFIRRPDGTAMHPYVLLQLIEQISTEILQYRITQVDYNAFKFELVLIEMSQKIYVESKIRQFLEQEYLKCPVQLEFHYQDMLLPERKTGKQTVFICDMEE